MPRRQRKAGTARSVDTQGERTSLRHRARTGHRIPTERVLIQALPFARNGEKTCCTRIRRNLIGNPVDRVQSYQRQSLTGLQHLENVSVSKIETYKSAKTLWHYIFAHAVGLGNSRRVGGAATPVARKAAEASPVS